jgi:hypothetical protein
MNYLINFETFRENKALFDRIVVFLTNVQTNISGKKQIVYQKKNYWYSFTICFNSFQSTLISVQPNEYRSYLNTIQYKFMYVYIYVCVSKHLRRQYKLPP